MIGVIVPPPSPPPPLGETTFNAETESGVPGQFDAPTAVVARLLPGTRLGAGDREIVVHMRTQDPVVATLGNVLDADECRTLIEMARPRLAPSTLVDLTTGRDIVSDVWVAGRQLVSEGDLTRLEWPGIAARANAWAVRMEAGG